MRNCAIVSNFPPRCVDFGLLFLPISLLVVPQLFLSAFPKLTLFLPSCVGISVRFWSEWSFFRSLIWSGFRIETFAIERVHVPFPAVEVYFLLSLFGVSNVDTFCDGLLMLIFGLVVLLLCSSLAVDVRMLPLNLQGLFSGYVRD